MIRALLCLAAVGPLLAQEAPPRAEPVDPALQANPGEDWYQHGRNLYEAAKKATDPDQKFELYGRAVDVLTRYLGQYSNHPNSEAAYWYLGESYYASGRIDDAKRCFHNLVNRRNKSRYASAAANRLAVDHYQNRQYALAAPLFEKMAELADVPEHRYRGLYFAAVAYEAQGRTREATDYYRKLLEQEGGNPYIHQSQAGLGRLLARAQKLDEALPLLDKAVMSRSAAEVRGPAAVEAGMVAAKMGQPDLSDKYLSIVLTTPGMEKYRPDAQYAMMAARFDRKDYKGVTEVFRRSAEKAQGEQEALRLMLAAKSYMALDKNVEALELFREVEKLMLPNNVHAFEANYLRLMCFYRIEGRHVPEQVDAFLDLYQKNRPRDAKIHTALLMKAETLMDAKKAQEAAKVYNEIDASVLSAENRRGLYFKRACALLTAGDSQGAMQSFSDFIKNYPDDPRIPEALMQRAQAFANSGDMGKAVADYDQIISRDTKDEYKALAYLESADLAKQQGNLPDMISRYQTFLQKVKDPSKARQAKANYWLAWGLMKSNAVKDALPYAEAARNLDPKVYGKNSSVLLTMGNWSLQNPDATCDGIDRGIKEDYADQLPDQLIDWAAQQAYNAERYSQASRFYKLIVEEDDPRVTPKETWRYLGKALLKDGKAQEALGPIDNALAVEDNLFWKSDGLLDKAKALMELDRLDEAATIAGQCQDLKPQGRVNSEVRLVIGDIWMKRNDPAKAAAEYTPVVVLMLDDNDKVLKPLAYSKLIKALDAKGDKAEADKYRGELQQKYPDWQPPKA